MKSLIEKFKGSTYIRQIATLMSGTLISQVLMLAIIPVLTRIYTPAEFGIYSLFFSVATILGLVSSWKYDQAIMLPKSDKDANALLFLSIVITLFTALVTLFVILIFHDFLMEYFGKLDYFIWLIPLSVLVIGLFQVFNAYSTRHELYKKIMLSQVTNSTTTVTTQTLSRYLFNFNGLIIGKVLGDLLALLLLVKSNIKENTLHLKDLSKRRVVLNMKKYDDFPKYQSFNVFINSISQNVPVILFVSLFSPEIAGFYSLMVRALQAPVLLIGSSTRQVFYQKASKLYAEGKSFYELYKKTTLGLLKLFIAPFLVIFLFGDEIFSFVFGEEWRVSGEIARISIFWFLFGFINPPSTVSFNILSLQKVQLKFQIVLLFLRVLAIYGGFLLFGSYMASIILYAIVGVSVNSSIMLYIAKRIKAI
jgi:O-antigen/teichoic acid export membrane protein